MKILIQPKQILLDATAPKAEILLTGNPKLILDKGLYFNVNLCSAIAVTAKDGTISKKIDKVLLSKPISIEGTDYANWTQSDVPYITNLVCAKMNAVAISIMGN